MTDRGVDGVSRYDTDQWSDEFIEDPYVETMRDIAEEEGWLGRFYVPDDYNPEPEDYESDLLVLASLAGDEDLDDDYYDDGPESTAESEGW